MLRHKNLHPLSHQHHNALSLCVLVERSLREDSSAENLHRQAERCRALFETEITNHFGLEEEILFPLVEQELGGHRLLPRLRKEHEELRDRIAALGEYPRQADLLGFCEALRAHVRLEEGSFFEDIQAQLPAEVFDKAGEAMKRRAIQVCVE